MHAGRIVQVIDKCDILTAHTDIYIRMNTFKRRYIHICRLALRYGFVPDEHRGGHGHIEKLLKVRGHAGPRGHDPGLLRHARAHEMDVGCDENAGRRVGDRQGKTSAVGTHKSP